MNNLQKKLIELDATALANLYKNLFATIDGQLVLQDLKDRCFVNTSTLISSPTVDLGWLARNEGMRSVVLHIETQMNYEPMKEDL